MAAARLLLLVVLLAAGHAGCRGASVSNQPAQLLCVGGATAASSGTVPAAGCVELRLPPADARLAGEDVQDCSHEVIDFLCASEGGGAPCLRMTADGRAVAKRSFKDSSCLRHACTVRWAAHAWL
jgi:hypothetical protein